MNFTLWRSSWLLRDHMTVGVAQAMILQYNLTDCPSKQKADCGLMTNLGAACLRSMNEI